MATHWTTYDAAVAFPVTVRGSGPLELTLRFARVLPETAVVDLFFGGRRVHRFTCRGGLVREERVLLDGPWSTPARVALRIDSHDRQHLGLRVDWLRLDTTEGTRTRLAGPAAWRPAAVVALVFVVLRLGGWCVGRAALLALVPLAAVAWSLDQDPWRTHRLLTWVPEGLALFGGIGGTFAAWLRLTGRAALASTRTVTALAVLAFLVRATLLNHPDYYYPDLMSHGRLVLVLREVGPRFFLSPARYVGEHGAWSKEAYGGVAALPYTATFHAPFALLGLPYDHTLSAFKVAGAALTVVPLVVVWAVARRLGVAPLGAVLTLLVPTYTTRLALALLPALAGHAADMLLVAWLFHRLPRIREPRVLAAGAAVVAACQLTYVSSVVNTAALSAVLLAALLLRADTRPMAGPLALAAAGGAAGALGLYYRDFVPGLVAVLGRGPGAGSVYPVESWMRLTWSRTRDFFGVAYPLLAALGAPLLRRASGPGGLLAAAWGGAYLLLLLLRAKVPDVFRYGHETLFVTPLVCLLGGAALGHAWARGRAWKVAVVLVVGWLAWHGAIAQLTAVEDQTRNAL